MMNLHQPLAPRLQPRAMTMSQPPHQWLDKPQPIVGGALRRGKWTQEEEEYAASIIQHFLSGVLPIQYGTTLRGYIAQLLHCDPMRVSKKLVPGSVFVGVRIDPKIGRRSYYPCPVDTPGLEDEREHAKRALARHRALFVASIEREDRLSRVSYCYEVSSPLKRKRCGDESPHSLRPSPLTTALPPLTDVLRAIAQTAAHSTATHSTDSTRMPRLQPYASRKTLSPRSCSARCWHRTY